MIGDIYFVKSSSPLSWIVRKLTKNSFSHVCISVCEDDSYVMEADAFKTVDIIPNKYLQDGVVVKLDLSNEEKVKLITYLMKQKNLGYDYRLVIAYLLFFLGIYDFRKLWNVKNRVICSELVDSAYGAIGRDLIPNKDGIITPADLAEVLLKNKSE